MNPAETVALYEVVADITVQMLAAARNSEWDSLCALEAGCAQHIRTLESAANTANGANAVISVREAELTESMRLRKCMLIEKILDQNREIQQLTQSRLTQLSGLRNQARIARQMSTAYGRHQAPRG